MATISENLQTLKTSVSAIKQAISDKGGDVSGDISTWANTISNIEGGGGGKEIVEVNDANGSIIFAGNEFRPSFEPNKIYYATIAVLQEINIRSVVQPTDDVGEYTLHFTTTDVSILAFETPSNWIWANGEIPSLEANTHYELSVVATKFMDDYIYKAVLTPFKSV